jgi:hypothetical protein
MGDLSRWKNVKNGLIMMGDLPKWKKWWSHCDRWPPQKKMVSLWWVTYPGGKNNGLIVMGDLPKERWSHYDGWPTQMEKMWLTWQKDLVGEVLTG